MSRFNAMCFLIFMCSLLMVACALTDPEKAALATKAGSVVEEVLRNVPGGGLVNDVLSLAGAVYVVLFGKKKIGQMKDSGKGEFFTKEKKTKTT